MARIVYLKDGYTVNFDDHCLYHENKKITEIHKRQLQVLEYLSTYPNCYKTNVDINNYLDEGCLSAKTIRGYVSALYRTHDIFRKVIQNKRENGYKYIGERICEKEYAESYATNSLEIAKTLNFYLSNINGYIKDFLNAIVYCSCKWGSCTHDETHQNTNTCEGIMAILSSHQDEKYYDSIQEALSALLAGKETHGLKSKSLDEETIVPTSMFLYIGSRLNPRLKESINLSSLAGDIWNTRSPQGWGIYVKNMGKYSNIGCTYWALIGLHSSGLIPKQDFQAYLKCLFKYDGTYSFGRTIDTVNPRVPCLYSTSMMYILYHLLSGENKEQVALRYEDTAALEYIVKNFDNPFFLIESEGITGVEVNGKISVHTVNWNHISIHYSLKAIASAIKRGIIPMEELSIILQRIEQVITENSEKRDNRMYWCAPNMTLDKGNRGQLIFPTMHLVIGLSEVYDAVKSLIEPKL